MMSSYARLACRGLVPATGTAVVAATWMGERASTNVSSRISSKIIYSSQTTAFYRLSSRQRFTTKSPPANTATEATTATTSRKEASSSKKKGSLSFMEWYEGHLQARPVLTKMCTGCFLWGVGDAVAQVVPPLFYPPPKDGPSSNNNNGYDFARTGRACLFGFALHAPTSHVHFNFLEWLTVRSGVSTTYMPFFKAFMEQFVYWSWLSNSMYHGFMGAMQGQNPTEIYHRIEDVLWETQKAQWVFWIPVQLINFKFVPVRHQLNVVLLTSIVWTALLSAWYPPIEKKEDEEKKTKE